MTPSVQPNQPSSAAPSFFGRFFASRSPERKQVRGITYSVAKDKAEARPTRSIPTAPPPDQPMRSSLVGLVRDTDTAIRETSQSTSKHVERTVSKIQEKEQQQEVSTEQGTSSLSYLYESMSVAVPTVCAGIACAVQYRRGSVQAACLKTLPAILSIYAQTKGAIGQSRMAKIQAQETQDTHDLGLLRDELDSRQTSLLQIMEDLTKSLERYMNIAQQEADVKKQFNTRG